MSRELAIASQTSSLPIVLQHTEAPGKCMNYDSKDNEDEATRITWLVKENLHAQFQPPARP